MEKIRVTLPGGETFEAAPGVRAGDAAPLPSDRRVVAASVDGSPVDLSRPVREDCAFRWIALDSPEGTDILRHSTAHLMAQAVQSLFPGTQVTIGPTTRDGFYYDFKRATPFTPDEVEKVEARMRELAQEDLSIAREEWPRAEAMDLFRGMGEDYKVEILEELPDETVSLYRQGDWVDLCRGPHLPGTGFIQAFKLTSVAGAYWRGDEKNEMLQRIYGTAFPSRKQLKEHLALLEAARKRDHRRLGKEMDLFSFHPEAPSSPFFHPKGTTLYNTLVDYMRGLYLRYGYEEVITPQIFDAGLWRRSGHYDHYKDHMYFTHVDERELGVKPMNCPGHTFLYASKKRSYRDLPVRLADFGRLHRYEKSGVTAGLTRVRSFSQDDAHIFCAAGQIEDEIALLLDMLREVYHRFQFEDLEVFLSTRPDRYLGALETWERAEAALAASLEKRNVAYEINEGDGAFYGPKIDFVVKDAMKRGWQLGTVQLDFSMPERFDLAYVSSSGAEERPVMIHRAILGSIERFMALLIEHTGGAFPLWLAPVQSRVVTVTDMQKPYAASVRDRLREAGWRVELDERNEKLGFKIREAQLARIPYAVVIGDKEVQDGTLSARKRGGENLPPMLVEAFLEKLGEDVRRETEPVR